MKSISLLTAIVLLFALLITRAPFGYYALALLATLWVYRETSVARGDNFTGAEPHS